MKKVLLLDFDGTIAHLFKNYSLSLGAEKVNKALMSLGYDFKLKNPFDIYKKGINKDALLIADKIIEDMENEAIDFAIKIDYLDTYLEKLFTKYDVAIVTNNSKSSIEKFFNKEFPNLKPFISGRNKDRIEDLKPSPKPLSLALDYFNKKPEDAVFVGDGLFDLEASNKLLIDFIAMGALDYKYKRFIDKENVKAIVRNYKELYEVLLKL